MTKEMPELWIGILAIFLMVIACGAGFGVLALGYKFYLYLEESFGSWNDKRKKRNFLEARREAVRLNALSRPPTNLPRG